METVNQNFADKERDLRAVYDEDETAYEQEGGSTAAAAYSGEEYRQELREGLDRREEQITSLPWASGSGFRGDYPGYFFCARVGDEMFMRFVPLGMEPDDDPVRDTLTCLQRIECTEDTERVLPDELREGVYETWEIARADIYEQWQNQTDPLAVQPDIRKLFREVGQHLRDHWPAEAKFSQEELTKAVNSVEAPWGRRYENELREVYEQEDLDPVEKSRQLVAKIDDLGLQPYEAPDPLNPIDEEEVKLVAWMVIVPTDNEGRAIRGESADLLSQTTLGG